MQFGCKNWDLMLRTMPVTETREPANSKVSDESAGREAVEWSTPMLSLLL